MRPEDVRLHLGGVIVVLLLMGASAQSTTPAPSAGLPFRLSVMIDGVVYAMHCNLTGLNVSNCTFAMDHGLTVSRASGSAEIPSYMQGILWATVVMVGILLVMAAATVYLVRRRRAGPEYSAVETSPPPQQYAPPQPQYVPPQQYANPSSNGPTGYDPAFRGQAAAAGGRSGMVIAVNLVQPRLPPEGLLA